MAAPLYEALERFTVHHHVTLLHRDAGDRLAALAPFLRHGLARREKCLISCDHATGDAILSGLRESGVDVGNVLSRGSILLARPDPGNARKAAFDRDGFIQFLRKAARQARSEKYSALRICLDMAFVLGKERKRDRILEFQGDMHSFLADNDCLALCMYGMEELPAEILLDALRCHPYVVFDGRAQESLFFVHPTAEPAEMTASRELSERLSLLAERHDQVSRIRRQAIRLRRMQDVTVSLLAHAAVPDLLKGITEGVISLGYQMCWIGMARPDGSVEPVARWGDRAKYLDDIQVRWDDSPLGTGPVGNAIRNGRPDVIRDILRSRRFSPWKDSALARGFLSVASVPLTENGKPVGALAVYSDARDAFDRESVEELSAFALQASLVLQRAREFRRLSESEERFRRLFERIPAACFTFDRHGIIRHWNMHCRSLYGYSPKEALGKPVTLVTGPAGGKDPRTPFSRIFSGESFFLMEREDRGKGGGAIWVLSNTYPYRGPDNEVELGISVNVDISGQREARRALAESEEKFRTVVEEIDPLVVELDPQGKIRLFNRSAERFTGYAEEEVLGKDWFPLFLPDREREDARKTFRGILEGKEAKEFEIPVLTKGGRETVIRWNTKPIRNDDGELRGVIGLGVDVTELKKREEEKERMRHSLAQAQKMEAVGALAGGIAHDFNNILGAIIGHASHLQSRMDPADPHRESVRKIQDSAERAAELTTQLLGFARGGKYHVEPLSLNDIVNDVVAVISRSFDRSIEIRTELDPSLRTVEGDKEQLRHSLLNLCLNARDAMPSGGTLTLKTGNADLSAGELQRYHVGRAGPCAVLTVADSGEGLEEEVKRHIFEPFFTTRREKGHSGMGLPMVYGIVKNHHGGIHAEGSPGRGSTFTIYLPATERKKHRKPDLPFDPLPKGTETILLVDDEPAIREMGKELLAALGYRVLLADDGEAACRVFAEHAAEIRLVLLDIVMPRMGGKETFASLRRMDPGIPVLLSSGYTVEGLAREILDAGADDFIQKPYRMTDLARALRSILDSPRSR